VHCRRALCEPTGARGVTALLATNGILHMVQCSDVTQRTARGKGGGAVMAATGLPVAQLPHCG